MPRPPKKNNGVEATPPIVMHRPVMERITIDALEQYADIVLSESLGVMATLVHEGEPAQKIAATNAITNIGRLIMQRRSADRGDDARVQLVIAADYAISDKPLEPVLEPALGLVATLEGTDNASV